MVSEVAMDAEAKAFIGAALEKHKRRSRLAQRIWIAVVVAQVVAWWTYFLFWQPPAAFSSLWVKVVVSVSFPPFILQLIAGAWLGTKPALRRLQYDYDGGILRRAQGRFQKGPGPDNYNNWTHLFFVDGDVVCVPHAVARELPDEGEGTFCYFPNIHVCWTYNGDVVWKPEDYASALYGMNMAKLRPPRSIVERA